MKITCCFSECVGVSAGPVQYEGLLRHSFKTPEVPITVAMAFADGI